ncbi:AAA family ATPase [Nevskia soli]|uniref:AAA family ATPase n=1 Tax=Nevskia soli TaxID=418856 RepID=UPI0015D755D2|nr:AAA family ATPase [Nevskia soli]
MLRTAKRLDPTQTGHDAEKLNHDLFRRIVGQDDAISQIVSLYQTFLAGMASPGRPVGNLLFLGPTGSGKTRMVEAVAESLVGDMRAVIKIDCAEFQHSHEIAKLIGSPPGYLGHRETHPLLSQEVLNQYHTDRVKVSFVLFDEIEKASDSLWNLLLGILDKATLTLGDNRRVDFSRAMIFMTSNLGAHEMNSILMPKLGFQACNASAQNTGRTDEKMCDKITKSAVEAARRKFTPEFMNRIDKVIVFKPLGTPELEKILDIELNAVQQRVFSSPASSPFVFTLTAAAKQFLLTEGTDLKYGARHLKRAIERSLVYPLSNLVASCQLMGGDLVKIDFDEALGILSFVKEAENLPAYAMAQMVDHSITMPANAAAAIHEFELPKVAGAKSRRA